MPISHAARLTSDAEFLGLEPGADPGRLRVPVSAHLVRPDLRLYGGSAVSISVAAAERVTDRDAMWMTTQFVSTIMQDEVLDIHVEVLADGKRTKQVRVTGTGPDGVVFASLGATGVAGGELTAVFETPPVVTTPAEDAGAGPFGPGPGPRPSIDPDRPGWHQVIEIRSAEIRSHPDPGPSRLCMWMRRRDGRPVTPAVAAYMADFVPISVARGLDVPAYGTSLDNTIRIGSFVETEWVLLDLRPHLAVGGYGHGAVHLWTDTGHLLGTASQTASMRAFTAENAPWAQDS